MKRIVQDIRILSTDMICDKVEHGYERMYGTRQTLHKTGQSILSDTCFCRSVSWYTQIYIYILDVQIPLCGRFNILNLK